MRQAPANEEALSEKLADLLDDDEDRRYDAARDIALIGRPLFSRVFLWANDPQPRMREMACYILGQMGDWDVDGINVQRYLEGLPVLLSLLETDPEIAVRGAAAAALGFYAFPETIPNLGRAAGDTSEDVRCHVAVSVGSFYECNWTEADLLCKAEAQAVLLRLMDDTNEDVRDWAAFGIHQGEHDTPEARARLWKALDDPNVNVRGEAAEGLALFGDRSFILRLDSLLREDADPSPLYFAAAEEFADPVLLPAVEIGAERWRTMEDREMHDCVLSALEALRSVPSDFSHSFPFCPTSPPPVPHQRPASRLAG